MWPVGSRELHRQGGHHVHQVDQRDASLVDAPRARVHHDPKEVVQQAQDPERLLLRPT